MCSLSELCSYFYIIGACPANKNRSKLLTDFRYGGIVSDHFIANFPPITACDEMLRIEVMDKSMQGCFSEHSVDTENGRVQYWRRIILTAIKYAGVTTEVGLTVHLQVVQISYNV